MNKLALYLHGLLKHFGSIVAGDRITNFDSVVFDANHPIATQTWTNAVITTLPTLAIGNAPAAMRRCAFSGDCRVVGHLWQHISQMFIEYSSGMAGARQLF